MKLIVGLGNPGQRYANNRHNIGFIALNDLVKKFNQKWQFESKFKADIAKIGDCYLLKPGTFMNLSGESVAGFVNFHKIAREDILVIHDDVDLIFGVVKKQFGAGSAGHRGVEDIIAKLGTREFWRMRVGIGRPNEDMSVDDYVLSNFSPEEIRELLNRIRSARIFPNNS